MHPIYAKITKIDETTRTVTGRAAHEIVDRDNEIFDYASSKPQFQKWSAEVFADSGGKSYGNVRSMHGNVAAGKLTDIHFDDVERAIDVSAKIVDDAEWEKCLAGVHTGFSIGGRYARKWTEAQNGKLVTRYTAQPTEISLVDRPCIPTAKFFSVHKKDGSVVRRAFANVLPCSSDPHPSALNAIRKVHAAGPTRPQPLLKAVVPSSRDEVHAAKARRLARRARRLARKVSGVAANSVSAIRKIHARGVRKSLGLPPQNANGTWGGSLADDGANGTWNRESAPSDKPARLGPTHAASIREGRPPAQDADVDPTVAALKRIFAGGPKRGL